MYLVQRNNNRTYQLNFYTILFINLLFYYLSLINAQKKRKYNDRKS